MKQDRNGMDNREANEQTKKESSWIWFLFSFQGRINRKPFWMFNLIVFLGGIVLGLFTDISHDLNEVSTSQLLFMIWIFWPSLAVQAKRWHDTDKSALWIFINVIPLVGPVWAIIQNGFIPGTSGANRFGSDPLEMNEA